MDWTRRPHKGCGPGCSSEKNSQQRCVLTSQREKSFLGIPEVAQLMRAVGGERKREQAEAVVLGIDREECGENRIDFQSQGASVRGPAGKRLRRVLSYKAAFLSNKKVQARRWVNMWCFGAVVDEGVERPVSRGGKPPLRGIPSRKRGHVDVKKWRRLNIKRV